VARKLQCGRSSSFSALDVRERQAGEVADPYMCDTYGAVLYAKKRRPCPPDVAFEELLRAAHTEDHARVEATAPQ
jgi:hypothetical protein